MHSFAWNIVEVILIILQRVFQKFLENTIYETITYALQKLFPQNKVAFNSIFLLALLNDLLFI